MAFAAVIVESPCDWERYRDWKAGHDEYETRQNAEIDALVRETRELTESPRQMPLGDYECPYCLQTSVRMSASKCPLCRSDIGATYWQAVRVKIAADKKAREAQAARKKTREDQAAAEWAKGAPERESAGRAAVAEAESAARAAVAEAEGIRRQKASREMILGGFMIGPALGAVLLGLAGCMSCVANAPKMNTLMTSFNLFNGLLYGALIGAVVGPVIGSVIAEIRK